MSEVEEGWDPNESVTPQFSVAGVSWEPRLSSCCTLPHAPVGMKRILSEQFGLFGFLKHITGISWS